MVAGSLLLGAAALHAAVFEDGFDRAGTACAADGAAIGASWKNAGRSNLWKIGGGKLRLDARSAPAILYSTALETTSGHGANFRASAEVAVAETNGWAGMVFNYQDAGNFYCLRFKGGTRAYQLLAKVDGEWSILASHGNAAEPFAPGAPYALEVFSEDAHEFHFTLRKPGEEADLNPVADATDSYSRFKNGWAGVYSPGGGGRGGPDALFDNFRVVAGKTPPRKHPRFTDGGTPREYRILEKTEVRPVWAATPVGFALETVGNRQFVAFYDADRQMTIAQRTLPSSHWTCKKLDSYLEWDSHNYIEMALDSGGYLHVSGNMHVVPLIYFRSANPYDVSSLQPIGGMTGEREQECTYPKFLKNQSGELIFNYRDGSSGDGDQIYNIYDVQAKTWSRLIDTPLADGEGTRNAYFIDPILGPDGWFHISWVWRENPGCESNHDLSYAKSQDLVNWFRADGTAVPLPFKLGTPGLIVDPVPVYGGILNGNGKIGFDFQGRPILAYHKFDENGNTQIYNARWENGAWAIHRTTNWDYRWNFSGGGSIVTEIGVGTVFQADGELRLPWSHIIEGSGEFILDETTLWGARYIGRRSWPSEIGHVRSSFPEMRVKLRWDKNRDSGYILRWETLPNNRDLPRDPPYPDPSDLQVYKVQ
jgi:hypothetical protein